MVAALVGTLGILLTALAPSLTWAIITYGLMAGKLSKNTSRERETERRREREREQRRERGRERIGRRRLGGGKVAETIKYM